MKRNTLWLALSGMLALLLASPGAGRAPRAGGFDAVAVSPDGKTVAVGGQNRVAYVLEASTLTVKRRIWVGARIVGLAFNRDGKRLLVADEDDRLRWYDPATGKAVGKPVRGASPAVSVAADLVAVVDPTAYPGARLLWLSLGDGSEKGRVELRERVSAFSFDGTGKRLVVLTASRPGDERKVRVADIPREMTGLAREEFRLKHDGQVASLLTLEVPRGKLLRQRTLWYTSDSDSTLLTVVGDVTWVLNFDNTCARIAADGTTKLFRTDLVFNQALGASADGKVLVAGGLREGTVGPPEGGKRVKFEIGRLSGAGEYFAAFAVQKDGRIHGVTSACRVVRVSKEGKVEKAVPVY
jgi:DNA-binding beta-propeller fold protein YncE